MESVTNSHIGLEVIINVLIIFLYLHRNAARFINAAKMKCEGVVAVKHEAGVVSKLQLHMKLHIKFARPNNELLVFTTIYTVTICIYLTCLICIPNFICQRLT